MISARQPRCRLYEKIVPTIAAPEQQSHTARNFRLPFAGMSTMTRTAAHPEPVSVRSVDAVPWHTEQTPR
jgi:hypothetical protein